MASVALHLHRTLGAMTRPMFVDASPNYFGLAWLWRAKEELLTARIVHVCFVSCCGWFAGLPCPLKKR